MSVMETRLPLSISVISIVGETPASPLSPFSPVSPFSPTKTPFSREVSISLMRAFELVISLDRASNSFFEADAAPPFS